MSLNDALNKANNVGKLDVEGIVNPDSINAKDAVFRGSLKITNNFNVYYGNGGGKSEVKNPNEKKVVDYGNGVKVKLDPHKKYSVCDDPLTMKKGTIRYNGHTETYYTTKQFKINRTACPVPGVHIATGGDGTVRDKDGYIVVACNGPKFGTVVKTSLGPGKIYDRGGMKSSNHYDIFTSR